MSREKSDLLRIAEKFETRGKPENIDSHGNGHINDTYLLTCLAAPGESCRYILQRDRKSVV